MCKSFNGILLFAIAIARIMSVLCFNACAQDYDLENDYTLLDIEFVAASFYISTSSTKIVTGTNDFSRGYVCTSKRFTKAEIPVGEYYFAATRNRCFGRKS